LGSEIGGNIRHSKTRATAKRRADLNYVVRTDKDTLELEIADATRHRNEKPNPKYVVTIDGFDIPHEAAAAWKTQSMEVAIDSGQQYIRLPLALSLSSTTHGKAQMQSMTRQTCGS
jgi:hypothetical protein